MFGSKGHEGYAEYSIRTGGENPDFPFASIKRKDYFCPLRFAYPVTLHGKYPIRPAAFQLLQIFQQLVSIGGNTQKPLRQLLLFHRSIAAPAAPLFHLFVGQYGMTLGAPVLRGLFAIYQSLFQPAQKKQLFPLIVFRMAGCQLAPPVIGIPQTSQLRPHVVDIGISPFGGMNIVLDGRVLGGKAKRVPPHGVQDIISLHSAETGHHVAYGIVAHMPHVNVAGRIRKHLQDIILGPGRIRFTRKNPTFRPQFLPFFFNALRIITGGKSHKAYSFK